MSEKNKPVDPAEVRREARGDQLDRLPLRLRRIAAEAMKKGFAARPDDDPDGPSAA